MDIAITCDKAAEYIHDALDGRLDKRLAAHLQAHLDGCAPCRLERSTIEGTRSTLRERLKKTPAPADLRRRVLESLSASAPSAPARLRANGLSGWFDLSGWRAPLAFAGALGIALIAFTLITGRSGHNHTRPSDGSVVTESFNNFDQVVDGRLKPGLTSDDPAKVKAFLEERVHFPIQMPSMKEFRLVGGQFTAVDNETTAHVIYERDGNFLYISQTDARRLVSGRHRFIPEAALSQLHSTGWFFAGNVTDCNLAMWLADSTLCTAVADLNRELLLANLTGTNLP